MCAARHFGQRLPNRPKHSSRPLRFISTHPPVRPPATEVDLVELAKGYERTKLVAFGNFFDLAMHVVPIGLVQLCDYATDLVCLDVFRRTPGMETFFYVGVGALVFSMLVPLALWWGLVPYFRERNMCGHNTTERLIFTLLVWFASLIAFRIHWLVAGNFRTGELSISALTQHQEQRAPPA